MSTGFSHSEHAVHPSINKPNIQSPSGVPGGDVFSYSHSWDSFNPATMPSSLPSFGSSGNPVENYRFGGGLHFGRRKSQPSDDSMVSRCSSDDTGLTSLPSTEGIGSSLSIQSNSSTRSAPPLKTSPSRNKHLLRLPNSATNAPIPPSLLDSFRRSSLPVSVHPVLGRSASFSRSLHGGHSPLGQLDSALSTDDEDSEQTPASTKAGRPVSKSMGRKPSKGSWPYEKMPHSNTFPSFAGPSPLSTSTSDTSYFPPQTKPSNHHSEGPHFEPSSSSINQFHGLSKFASYQHMASANAASADAPPPHPNLNNAARTSKPKTPTPLPPPISVTDAVSRPISHLLLDGHTLNPLFESRYDLNAVLGSGGYGFVCVAKDKRMHKEVAVKFILAAKVPSHAWVEWSGQGEAGDGMPPLDGRVPMECELLRRINHEGVVRGESVYADGKFFYLVQELHGASWGPSTPATPVTPRTPMTSASSYSTSANLSAVSSSLSLNTGLLASASPFAPSFPLPTSPACGPTSFIPNNSPQLSLEPRRPSLNMERRGSCDLFECVEANKRFTETKARLIFAQVVETVYALSKEGIYHRDIKDENIVIDRKLKAKLIDFGSAVWERGPEPVRYKDFFGTNAYASPEILDHKTYLASQAEVWSLGILLCILITGESPFSSSANAIVSRRSPLRNGVVMSKDLVDLIDRCLLVDPQRRIKLDEMRGHKWFRI